MNIYLRKLYLFLVFVILAFQIANAQSTNQNTPTPVVTNEISGTIRARAIGDSRLTNYFYAFNGNQGDVFINIVTKNLDGDFDIFMLEGLRALTKITLFSDNSNSETGRIIYLRKSEKLLLRIQGRSPNDEDATFRIKFAGSFEPLPLSAVVEEVKLPEINTKNQGEVIVNSVGTILGPVLKPTPKPTLTEKNDNDVDIVENISEKEINVRSVDVKTEVETSARIEIRKGTEETVAEKKEIDDQLSKNDVDDSKTQKPTPTISKPLNVITEDSVSIEVIPNNAEEKKETSIPEDNKSVAETKSAEPDESKAENSTKSVQPMKLDQLQKIELVVKFKDGTTIRRKMNKVFSFNVNQGILTIVSDDGNVSRYSLLDIEKVSIE